MSCAQVLERGDLSKLPQYPLTFALAAVSPLPYVYTYAYNIYIYVCTVDVDVYGCRESPATFANTYIHRYGTRAHDYIYIYIYIYMRGY
jgi:hypothetical protein